MATNIETKFIMEATTETNISQIYNNLYYIKKEDDIDVGKFEIMYYNSKVGNLVNKILSERYKEITFQNFLLYKQYILCEIIYFLLLHKLKDLKPLYNNETLEIINFEDFSSRIVNDDSLFTSLKDSEGMNDSSYDKLTLKKILDEFKNKIKNYIEFKNKIYTILEKKGNIRKFLNLEVIPPIIYEGGNSNIDKVKNINKKEILGKERCIYKKPGDRKEYLKHKGELITVKDYKKLMKDKK
jgi:hypothetical protein